jgi:tripartite-type tricarboxylate transporter receptor subunit TctC
MSNTHTTNETLIPGKSYELMRDLVPVAPVNYSDLLMVVSSSLEVDTLEDFIALARSRPGELNYASSGPGTPYHMAGELFKAMSETDIVHVPHRGSGEARASILGGHVDMMFDAITTMAPNHETGQVKALGVTGTERSERLPDVPTVDEAGVSGYTATIWLGLMAPAGTPDEIVEKLNAEINMILDRDDVAAAWAEQGAVPLKMSTSEFKEYMEGDIEKWAEVIRVSGAAVQ